MEDARIPSCNSSKTDHRQEDRANSGDLYRKWCDVITDVGALSPDVSTSGGVCYVIVSTTSLLWTALTLVATGLITVALMTPFWLVSTPRRRHQLVLSPVTVLGNRSLGHVGTVSIGVFNECTGLRRPELADILNAMTSAGDVTADDVIVDCGTFVSGFDMPDELFPDAWKSALVLLTGAAVLMTFTDFSALASICIQSIFGKSIFTVSGLLQSIAALLLVVGQLLYTVGWSSQRVRDVCGHYSGPFVLDQCHIGVSFYGCMAGTGLVFVCGLLSMRAETSTSTDQVEKQILDGRLVVCVP